MLAPLALAALTGWLIATGRTVWLVSVPWVPSLGIDASIRIDGLALQMLALISGVGVAVFVYGSAYMAGQPGRHRLFATLTGFMLAMVGCVTTDNLLVLFVFWELTSVASFLLVGFKFAYKENRAAAQQAMLVTGGGGLILLAGIVLLGQVTDTYSIQATIVRAPGLLDDPRLPWAIVCIIAGAFTKSAQWPFHFWLPNAMAAPTPVSAYLHSATMVKLGIYLLARVKPAFGDLFLWEVVLVSAGATTALWAMLLALRERDLKRILAWSTVSALGTLVLLIGLPGHGAAEATAALLLAHALYKAPLFFVAGNIDHSTGTRSIDRLAGMASVMPWTAAIALLAGLSMAGVPLSMGYVAKDLISIAKTEGLAFEWVSYTSILASAAAVAVASVAAVRVFWHRGGERLPAEIHEAPPLMIAAPLAVATLGTAFGIMPGLAVPLIEASARAMVPVSQQGLIGLPDTSGAVGTTLLTFMLGLLVFVAWDRLHAWMERLSWADRYGLGGFYERSLGFIPAAGRLVNTGLQHGRLPIYVLVTAATFAAAVAIAVASGPFGPWPAWSAPGLPVAAATLLIVVAGLGSCLIRDAFVMLLVSGLAGLGTAALCLFIGAPDVAFTQFTVEVAFVVVVAAVILRVRTFAMPASPATTLEMPRVAVALVTGGLVTTLLLLASAGPLDATLPRYFGERSLPDAFGRNVVNVIIVDFRALDTLGEIAVVSLAFMAALPLLAALAARATIRRAASGPDADTRRDS